MRRVLVGGGTEEVGCGVGGENAAKLEAVGVSHCRRSDHFKTRESLGECHAPIVACMDKTMR